MLKRIIQSFKKREKTQPQIHEIPLYNKIYPIREFEDLAKQQLDDIFRKHHG